MCGSKDGRLRRGKTHFLRRMKSFSLWIVVLIWRSGGVGVVGGLCVVCLFRMITLMLV